MLGLFVYWFAFECFRASAFSGGLGCFRLLCFLDFGGYVCSYLLVWHLGFVVCCLVVDVAFGVWIACGWVGFLFCGFLWFFWWFDCWF